LLSFCYEIIIFQKSLIKIFLLDKHFCQNTVIFLKISGNYFTVSIYGLPNE
jgi:hypothetical protein